MALLTPGRVTLHERPVILGNRFCFNMSSYEPEPKTQGLKACQAVNTGAIGKQLGYIEYCQT